eukprot:7137642-Heterocapsa_arctica.AAC.1
MKAGMGTTRRTCRPKLELNKHGYNASQKKLVLDNVQLARRVQQHMINTYKTYITNPLVRKDVEANTKMKGPPSGKK